MMRSMISVGMSNESTRIEWVKKALSRVPSGSRILDAGAGERRFSQFCRHLDYVTQDFGQYNGEGNAVGLHTGTWMQEGLDIVSDITCIPEPDSSFDAILCTEVFEHIPDPLAAIREFSRLLRSGGQLILTAPFCSLTHFAPFHYYTGFNRYFYEWHLPPVGFRIVEMAANGNFFEYVAQEIRRIEWAAERYASGRPGKLERYALRIVLGMLQRFSAKDSESMQLLNHGFHVLAVKN